MASKESILEVEIEAGLGLFLDREVLPTLIDQRARSGYARPYASIPIRDDPCNGFQDISYGVLANAINRCAAWLCDACGDTSSTFENIAYIGPHDLRYQILCFAAAKVEYVMFLPSPRNSIEAFLAVLEQAQISRFIVPSVEPKVVGRLFQERSMERLPLPDLDWVLDKARVAHIPFDHDFEEYRLKPWVLLHTSGSAGIPKVIALRHGYPTIIDGFYNFPLNEMAQRCGRLRMFVPSPPSHMAGLMFSTAVPCFIETTVVLPPTSPMEPNMVNAVHVNAKADFTYLPPSTVTELANVPAHAEGLKKLKGLCFAGGPLPVATGDSLKDHTTIYSSIGATEYFCLPFLPKDPENWQWLRFDMDKAGVQFEPVGDGAFEMVLVRDDDLRLTQAVFVTFPELQTYRTKDLFVPHPSKAGLWKYHGRLDDVIVLDTGEKFNPVSMEGTISTCPDISGCLVVGSQRFQTALIVEKRGQAPSTSTEESELLNKVWKFVDRANKTTVEHGRLVRELMMCTTSEKPFPRAGKGTIQRNATNTLYKKEIDNLFDAVQSADRMGVATFDVSSRTAFALSLERYIDKNLDLGKLAHSDDLFEAGMDSLQTITLVRSINTFEHCKIDAKAVYEHSSINALTDLIMKPAGATDFVYESDDDQESLESMKGLYEKAAAGLSTSTSSRKLRATSWFSSTTRLFFPPDGGSEAWLQVLGSFLINVNNWGILNSSGAFQAFYEQDFLSNSSASTIGWIGTLHGALLLIVGVVAGPLFDKGYFRTTLLAATVLFVFALMMLSLSTTYWQVMLTQGLLAGVAVGLLFVPSLALISLFFTQKRAFALGIATSGGAVGGIIYPIMFRRHLTAIGFAWTVRAIGLVALVTLLLAAALLKSVRSSRQPSRMLFDQAAMTEIPFVAFMVAGFLLYSGVLVPYFLIPSYAEQVLRTGQDTAFYLIAVANAGQVFGRILAPVAAHYVGPEVILLLSELLLGVLGLLWIAVKDVAGFVVWLVVYGFATGSVSALSAAVLPLVCPSLAVLGTRFGMVYAVAGLGVLISVPVATAALTNSTVHPYWTTTVDGVEYLDRRLLLSDHLFGSSETSTGNGSWSSQETLA